MPTLMEVYPLRVNRAEYLKRRELAGYRTDASVAEAIGISRQRFSQILNAEDASSTPTGTISRLARVLNCSIDELWDSSDDDGPPFH